VAVYHSCNVVGSINKLTLCQVQLVLGWVTIFGRIPPWYLNDFT